LKSDGFYLGITSAYQGIRIKITKVLKGVINEKVVVTYFLLLGKTEVDNEGYLVLQEKYFKKGRKIKVTAMRTRAGCFYGKSSTF
jgi:hypothetical protein